MVNNKTLNNKIFRIQSKLEARFVFHPSGCERPHVHPDSTIAAVVGGSLCLNVDGTSKILRSGEVSFIAPYCKHYVDHYSKRIEGVYVLYLIDSDRYVKWLINSTIVRDRSVYEKFVSLCGFLFERHPVRAKEKAVISWINENSACATQSARDNFNKFRHCCNGLPSSIKTILDTYKGERAPVGEIAHAFNRSKEHCNRSFKAAYNVSIQAYFLNKKAHNAKDLLEKDGDLCDVSLTSGFYDQSHFVRVFKGIFQMTPNEFRTSLQKTCQSHTIRKQNIEV